VRPRLPRLRPALGALAAAGLLTLPAAAHQFWIEPSTWHPDAGALLRLQLLVGERLVGDEVPRRAERSVRFALYGPDGAVAEARGVDGRVPAGVVRAHTAGVHVAVHESDAARLELDGEAFTAYLEEEGLTHVLEARAAAGASDRLAREAYARSAKALVRVGTAGGTDAWLRPVGLPLELAPLADPTRLGDAPLRVRLLSDGEPMAGARVTLERAATEEAGATSEQASARIRRVRTDAEGAAAFDPLDAGTWLLHAVRMVPAEEDEPDLDWRSDWASLHFRPGH